MINILNNLTIRQRVFLLVILSTVGFSILGISSFNTLKTLQVNGPLYQRIIQGKDLVADILPPPEYIIESYLTVLQLASEENEQEKVALAVRLKRLHQEYVVRHDYWVQQNLEPEIRELFIDYSYNSAVDFYKALFNEFLPAIDSRNTTRIQMVLEKLGRLYMEHRNSIDKIVPLVNQRVSDDEGYAGDQTVKATQMMLMITIVILLISIVLVFLIARSIIRSLGGEPKNVVKIIDAIAQGNLEARIDLDQSDNFSVLASLNSMKIQLGMIIEQMHHQVSCMVAGDFGQQIDLRGKQGFSEEIASSLNQLSFQLFQKIGGNPDVAVQAANQIAAGNLDSKIDVQNGDENSMLAAIRQMQLNLKAMIDEVRIVVDAAANGDFSHRLEEQSRQGYAKTLAQLLNRLSEVSETSLSEISRAASSLGEGDLTQVINVKYPGLFGDTVQGINQTRNNLLNLIYQLVEVVESIHESTEQIASGNLDLSQRTEQQAASLQENATSIEHLASTVKLNADNTQLANKLVQETSSIAYKSGDAVAEVVKTMESIYESSYKVADIISVIDGLSFQTNILALNAAVEAARAGEQGRGFAVVASEVRSLAQRSAAAAKEIKELIANSVSKVESGNDQVEKAGNSMNEVVTAVSQITDLVSDISVATSSQSQGIIEVNQSIAQMDAVTQQNAALVEQAAAAAKALEEQTYHLRELVAVFQLPDAERMQVTV